MSQNNFLLPTEQYKRAISPIRDWIKQTALYASRMLDKPFDACVAHLEKKVRAKQVGFHDPRVSYYYRGENGDRHPTTTTLANYVYSVIQNNEILAPSFTTYLHPSVKVSFLVEYQDENVAVRKKYKKTAQKYEAEGNTDLYKYFNQLQDNAKRGNNAVSGGMVAEGSVIMNKSGHSTLTSTIRSISSLSNASNERLIEGNRHYFTPQIALNNVISIVAETDHDTIHQAMTTYGIAAPSVDNVMSCIKRSTDMYWQDRKATSMIRAFVEKLTPVERASVVYTGDLYHLRIFNEGFVRDFITDFARRGTDAHLEDPVGRLYKTDEQIVNYAHQINISMLAGKGKEYAKNLTAQEQCILANTCINIENTIDKYKLFLKAFFLTKNSPCTIATVPNLIRRSVVLSDTDSTMFACDNWVEWYFGRLRFDDEGYAMSGAIMFIATQSIAHILALFSANVNVESKRLYTLAMKPEFVFPVFAQTSAAKHYYTARLVKEGNVYKDIQMEIKGVHMKDSTVPAYIIDGAAKEMENIIRTVMRGDQLNLADMIEKTCQVEREILASLYKGESTYLKRFKIKESKAYVKEPHQSPYAYYMLWEQAFAPVYGSAPAPPYGAVRIPLKLKNKTAVKEWIENMPNRQVAENVQKWFVENNKTTIQSFPIPVDYCNSHGVPPELAMIMNVQKIVLNLTKSYRNILESLGYFAKAGFLVSELQAVPKVLK